MTDIRQRQKNSIKDAIKAMEWANSANAHTADHVVKSFKWTSENNPQ